MNPLDGCRWKIEWGHRSLEELRFDVDLFFGDSADPNSPRGHLESRERQPLPENEYAAPWEWSLRIGDIIHSFRSALDNLAWEVAIACRKRRGEDGPPSSLTQFPICDNVKDFERMALRYLSDFGDVERDLVANFQPYQVATSDDRHPLAWLRDLSNRDKHRTLNIAIVGEGGLTERGIESLRGWAMTFSSWSNQATIQAIDGPSDGGEFEVRLHALYEVNLEGENERLDWVLDPIESSVREIFAAFEPIVER